MTCPKQGREMEAVVLHRVGFLAYSCPKQGQDLKSSAAPLYPNIGQVPPPGLSESYIFVLFNCVVEQIKCRHRNFHHSIQISLSQKYLTVDRSVCVCVFCFNLEDQVSETIIIRPRYSLKKLNFRACFSTLS